VPDVVLVIAGDGESKYVSRLRSRVASLGLENCVVFHGFADERAKQRLLATATAFVLPSFHENFGVAALEAAHAGVPVVISSAVHLGEFIREQQLGVISTGGAEELASAIVTTLRDEELQRRCRDRGQKLVAEAFAPTRIGERLMTMYTAVVDATRAPLRAAVPHSSL
jgi:glycosyltransferase involved in cell wall biosynthesis